MIVFLHQHILAHRVNINGAFQSNSYSMQCTFLTYSTVQRHAENHFFQVDPLKSSPPSLQILLMVFQ